MSGHENSPDYGGPEPSGARRSSCDRRPRRRYVGAAQPAPALGLGVVTGRSVLSALRGPSRRRAGQSPSLEHDAATTPAGRRAGIGLWLVVVSPQVKQIHAVLCRRSSGPTISSGRPRRLISSRSFMSMMSSCPAGSYDNPPGGFPSATSGVGGTRSAGDRLVALLACRSGSDPAPSRDPRRRPRR